MIRKLYLSIAIALLAIAVSPVMAGGAAKDSGNKLSGNIGIFSQYILRGGVESNDAVIQGGLDYEMSSGIYLGYWGSSLPDRSVYSPTASFEHDLYGGYKGKIGNFGFDLGLIRYVYQNNADADATEVKGRLEIGPVTLGFNTLLDDVTWGNEGDTWWTISASKKIGRGFTVSATAVFYSYENAGQFESSLGTTNDDGFKNLDVTFSHAIGKTGADANFTYVVGGEDRTGTDVEDQVVFSVTYGFDL